MPKNDKGRKFQKKSEAPEKRKRNHDEEVESFDLAAMNTSIDQVEKLEPDAKYKKEDLKPLPPHNTPENSDDDSHWSSDEEVTYRMSASRTPNHTSPKIFKELTLDLRRISTESQLTSSVTSQEDKFDDEDEDEEVRKVFGC